MNLTVFNSFPVLASERLQFREFELSDATEIFQMKRNEIIMRYTDRPSPQSVAESEEQVKRIRQSFVDHTGMNWILMEKETKVMTGTIGFWRIDQEHNRAEIGYMLKPEFWGRGLMTEAIKTAIGYAFKQMEVHSIEANVNPLNSKSINVLERCGFKKEAYFRENYFSNGRYLDSLIYSLLERDLD